MNCFEARQEFSALWRKTATAERRAELLAHLKGCGKCGHAFRVFALTAPVLHGEIERDAALVSKPARREFSLADRPRRFASVSRETLLSRQPNRWLDVGGGGDLCIREQRGVSFDAGAE